MTNLKKECPVCKASFNKFSQLTGRWLEGVEIKGKHFPINSWETLNVDEYLCPNCRSSDRARLYYIFLEKEIFRLYNARKEKIDMLHFAPESGKFKDYLKTHPSINYRTADLFMQDVDDHIDITSMKSYNNEKFDLILCSHVLEHVDNDKNAVSEISRILRPGGIAILMVPILIGIEENYEDASVVDTEGRWKVFGQGDHVRVYSKNGFKHLISDAGKLEIFEYSENFFGKEIYSKYGIDSKSTLYVARKPLYREDIIAFNY